MKYDENTSTHYLSSTAVVANMNFVHKYPLLQRKKYFVFVKRLPIPVNVFYKKVFHETLTNHDKSLSTHYSHFARVLSDRQFPLLFANSV